MRSRAPVSVYAISDLHVGHHENQAVLDDLHPARPGDWLIIAGDLADDIEAVEAALRLVRPRYAEVIWTPGNHELLADPANMADLRGQSRYEELVRVCRQLDVRTPEDPYLVWHGTTGPVIIVPLFILYDYSFGRNIAPDPATALAKAKAAGIICVDEYWLDPAPYASRAAWCRSRVDTTAARLEHEVGDHPAVLVNHFPLNAEPTRALFHPEFAQWCGTELTADWHTRFNCVAVVYGHLHIPRTTWYDGVRFEEVSCGYPREWRARGRLPRPRQILPAENW